MFSRLPGGRSRIAPPRRLCSLRIGFCGCRWRGGWHILAAGRSSIQSATEVWRQPSSTAVGGARKPVQPRPRGIRYAEQQDLLSSLLCRALSCVSGETPRLSLACLADLAAGGRLSYSRHDLGALTERNACARTRYAVHAYDRMGRTASSSLRRLLSEPRSTRRTTLTEFLATPGSLVRCTDADEETALPESLK